MTTQANELLVAAAGAGKYGALFYLAGSGQTLIQSTTQGGLSE